MLSIRQVSQALIGLVFFVALFVAAFLPFDATEAAACPPGWYAYSDGACHPPCAVKNSAECDKPQLKCNGECDQCSGMRGAAVGETGGPAGGCKDCGAGMVCELCSKKPNCTPTMHPSRFKNYKKKPFEPDLGIEEKPGGGVSDFLRQTKP